MRLAQLQKCLLKTKILKKKVIGRVQTRKWIKLALPGCHLSAWHSAPQTVGGTGQDIRDQNQTLLLVVVRVGGFVSVTVPEPLFASL